MKVLLDTNVLIAAFIAHGTCAEVLEYCVINHELISSAHLIEEFRSKMSAKFRYTRSEIRDAEKLLKPALQIVVPEKLQTAICRDADDDLVLATALAGKCNCILTGDKALLELRVFRGIDILLPANFWSYEAKRIKRIE